MSNDEFLKHLNRWNEKIFKGDGTLNVVDESQIEEVIKQLETQKKYLEYYLFEFEKVKMYNSNKKRLLENYSPFDATEIINSQRIEDEELLNGARLLVKENEINRDYMFGYPANLFMPDPIEMKLREEEAKLPYMNNCGDSSPLTRGNYVMDSKVYEQKILDEMYKNLNVDKDEYWGVYNIWWNRRKFLGN